MKLLWALSNISNSLLIESSSYREVLHEPIASLLITEMSQYKHILANFHRSKFMSSSPMLTGYPPHFYGASARYLAFCFVSISKHLLVMRRPLPLLARIASANYTVGVFRSLRIKSYFSFKPLPLLNLHSSHLSSFILSSNVSEVLYRINAIHFSFCLGIHVWYALIPNVMLFYDSFNLWDLSNPESISGIKYFSKEDPLFLMNVLEAADLTDDELSPAGESKKEFISKKLLLSLFSICVLNIFSYGTIIDQCHY